MKVKFSESKYFPLFTRKEQKWILFTTQDITPEQTLMNRNEEKKQGLELNNQKTKTKSWTDKSF